MAKSPIRPTDDDARALARDLINNASFGALAVIWDGAPMVTRIAITTDTEGNPITLVSDLSIHTKALRQSSKASLLIGEPGPRGDPLTHPRLTLQVTAQFVDKTQDRIDLYLSHQPKAKLYIDFTDFHMVRLAPIDAHLNGGFGKAFHLSRDDLRL